MQGIAEEIRLSLRDREYAEGYAESFLNAYVATQIKVLREQRHWKQADLAAKVGTTQTAISRVENINYSSWKVKTLAKLAKAFGVRLKISFEPFGTLPIDMDRFSRDLLERPDHCDDPVLWAQAGSVVDSVGCVYLDCARHENPIPIPTCDSVSTFSIRKPPAVESLPRAVGVVGGSYSV